MLAIIHKILHHLRNDGLLSTIRRANPLYHHPVAPPPTHTTYEFRDNEIYIQPLKDPSIEKPSTELKIAIVVHAYHLDKIIDICNYLQNMPYTYTLYFTVEEERREQLATILQDIPLEYEIVTAANHGYDMGPFLEMLPRLKEESVDIVCKIHTKKGAANLEEHVEGIKNIWLHLLLDPLLGSADTISKIVHAFQEHRDLGMLGSADLYKSAKSLMYDNESYTSQLLSIIDKHIDPAKDWGFTAGTMFWARLSTLEPLIEKKKEIERYTKQSAESMQTGLQASIFHAVERLFGLLPQIRGQKTALSYAINAERTEHGVVILPDDSTLYSPLGIGMSLQSAFDLDKNYDILKNSSEFDSNYYQEHTQLCSLLEMDALLHFLRYGIFVDASPRANFSPFTYWSLYLDILHRRINPLIDYISHSKELKHYTRLATATSMQESVKIIKKSSLFDAKYYKSTNPDVANLRLDPWEHFCYYGYKEGREPSAEFDILWYQSHYLQEDLVEINPLLHYLLYGKERDYLPRPKMSNAPLIQVEKFPTAPKRVTLFAAYDRDSIIDESVIILVKELARHSDVYFLSDSILCDDELAKVAPYTQEAWSIRHGEYDFGSYKRLATYLIGWEKIAQYDEVLLVNDSSYLLNSLDELFVKMGSKSCSWWGMQATKGMYHTQKQQSNQFTEKIAMDRVKGELLESYEEDAEYDFHIGSYFLAFRKPLLESGELQEILESVKKENNKKSIILKYEVGLTRRLINERYDFDTFMDDLYPFHPIFTNHHFDMVAEGFPLFKRFFLTENSYRVPELWRWKEKLSALRPQLNLEPIESNINRIADAAKLYNNLHISSDSLALLSDDEFIVKDRESSIEKNLWIFPVCAYDHTLAGNERAVFEEIKDDASITKVILFRSKPIDLEGANVYIIPLESREAQEYLLKSSIIFIKHTPRENTPYPLDSKKHKFINLWHGIPLKRIGTAALNYEDIKHIVVAEHSKCHSVIASSAIDRMAMSAAFHPLTYHDVWVTGLPRNDFVLREYVKLPNDFQLQIEALDTLLAGKKFILFAPTFRNAQADAYYNFTVEQRTRLLNYLKSQGVVLGIREHMADNAHSYTHALQGENVINVGGRHYPNIEVLYRRANLLITDYSSCFIDFMLTNKPMISFAYDYERYMREERGLFYELDFAFPGPICQEFDSLLEQIEMLLAHSFNNTDSYRFKQKLFFDYIDDNNAKRVIERVKEVL